MRVEINASVKMENEEDNTPTSDLHDEDTLVFVDQAYDPSTAPAFNVHLEDMKTGIIFTFTIDPSSPGRQAALVLHNQNAIPPGIFDSMDYIRPAKGLSYEVDFTEQGAVISVIPLVDTGRQNERGGAQVLRAGECA